MPTVSPPVHANPVRYTEKILFSSFLTRGPEAEIVKGMAKVTQVLNGGAGNHTRAMDLFYYTVYVASLGCRSGVSHPSHLRASELVFIMN